MVEQQTLNLQVLGSSPRQPTRYFARVAKLADALDLGSSPERGGGSSPSSCTKKRLSNDWVTNRTVVVFTRGVVAMKCDHLRLDLSNNTHNNILIGSVIIEKPLVNILYQHSLQTHQAEARTFGFLKGTTPLTYLERTLKIPIIEQLKEFLLKHVVIDFLYHELRTKNIVIIGNPRLSDMHFDKDHDATFTFDMVPVRHTLKTDWKSFSFKAPMRKNYKDLDRQADSFIKEETVRSLQPLTTIISSEDWIAFNVALIDKNDSPLLGTFEDTLWLKIGNEEVDKDARQLFLGKMVGESITSTNHLLRSYFTSKSDIVYMFRVAITDRVPHATFNFEEMKTFFGLKNTKDLHQKLIEVLSYRNDMSQRRETADAVLRLLIKHHPIPLPTELVQRQEHIIIKKMQLNPDYYVYRSQRDFMSKVRLLAEKQLKEEMIIDTIAYHENIAVTSTDIRAYLNLLQRPRTKEFIYFEQPLAKANGQEIPLSHTLLQRHCLREKTLNYVIRHLTNKMV
jgi:FKBP-type peptidyl-prolyl cis-trans isomerase (trigger factor)